MAALHVRIVRRLAAEIAGVVGYEVRPARSSPLERLGAAGVTVTTVLDVGAALGDWTLECARAFPEARFLLVEPLDEFAGALARVTGSLPGAEHVRAAAAATDGEVSFNVHADLVGSSVYREAEGGTIDGVPRTVPALSLDTLVRERAAAGPYLLKVDVQGAEPDVLRGAGNVLEDTVAVILEVSFFEFFQGGSLAHEVIALMAERGFVIYDVLDLLDRPLDGALAQANIVFVPDSSAARREKGFASATQRAAQDREFAAAIKARL
jgi:FkbM family methyltransferase